MKSHIGVPYKGQIFVFGGEKNIGENNGDVFVFDTVEKGWKKPAVSGIQIPALESHCSTIIENIVYVYGGYIADRGVLSSNLYSLDLDKMQWSLVFDGEGKNGPTARSNSAIVGHQGKLYLFGGSDG